MDPNAVWQRIREIEQNDDPAESEELLELYDNLNGWIAKGGFAPEGYPF